MMAALNEDGRGAREKKERKPGETGRKGTRRKQRGRGERGKGFLLGKAARGGGKNRLERKNQELLSLKQEKEVYF